MNSLHYLGFYLPFSHVQCCLSVRIACQCKHTHLKFIAFYIEFSINKLHPATFYALRTVFRSIPSFIRNRSSRCLSLSFSLCCEFIFICIQLCNYVACVCLCARLLILNVARDVNYHHFASNFAGFFAAYLIRSISARSLRIKNISEQSQSIECFELLGFIYCNIEFDLAHRPKPQKNIGFFFYRPINCAVCVRVRSRDT